MCCGVCIHFTHDDSITGIGSVDSKEWVERMCEDLAAVILERGENKE